MTRIRRNTREDKGAKKRKWHHRSKEDERHRRETDGKAGQVGAKRRMEGHRSTRGARDHMTTRANGTSNQRGTRGTRGTR